MNMTTSELISIIQKQKIAIYGAGYAAVNFYTALQIRHLDNRVVCFIVTDVPKAQGELFGKPIKAADDVLNTEDIYICIAVHETLKSEIESYLLKHNVNRYAWVHPYIFELALGTLVKKHEKVQTNEILQHLSRDNYALAIRYLAIENYYGKNDVGYQIYLKALCLQCEQTTAQKRLQRFVNVIESWKENGYKEDSVIFIDEGKRLIDGIHRLSLACYHGINEIYCDILPYSDQYGKVVKETHFLSIEALRKNHFSAYEIEAIEKVQEKLYQV